MRQILTLIFICFTPIVLAKNNKKNKMNTNLIIHTIRLLPHQDLKLKLDEYIKEHHIEAAFIQTCVGSLEKVMVRYANQKEATKLEGKFEIISLVGTLSTSGSCHIHLGFADSLGNAKGGHLVTGSLIFTTAEIVIAELPDKIYSRELDTTYGYKELKVLDK
jgi:uncharacterized protein